MQPVYLDRNENQYGPAPECITALKEPVISDLFEYSRDFTRHVKSCLSERLAQELGVDENYVILGYGAEDLLKQAIHCYLHEGEKIMIPSHSWWYYKRIASEVDGIQIEYPIVEGDHTFQYDLDEMLRIYQQEQPQVLLISSPNNPTGNRLESDELKRLLKTMNGPVTILDEAYTLFHHHDNGYLKELVEQFPNLIVLRTFSKYYALAGLRIGYALIGQNHARFSLFSAHYLGFNRISERVALAALDATDYYHDMCHKMVEDSDMLFKELNRIPGFTAYKTFANFILVRIPLEIRSSLKQFLTSRGMIVKFMDEEHLNCHIRISIGTREQNRLLMELIREFMTTYA